MTAFRSFVEAMAQLEGGRHREHRRGAKSDARRHRPPGARCSSLAEPWPPSDDPAAIRAWRAYLAARQRAGEDHASVVRLDIQ